jgi:RNA polymerase sigma-70 factor (ECF subfamily)
MSHGLGHGLLVRHRMPGVGAAAGYARNSTVRMPSSKSQTPADASEALRMSDRLVAIGQSGDRAAFEAVFEYFAPRLKAYLMRAARDPSLADEVMQETMVVVWRKAAQYDPAKASAATWIFTIARNLRIDAFRRGRRPEIDPSDPAFIPEMDMPADQAIVRQETESGLRNAMAALSATEQQLLQMAFYEDLSHSAIAAQLGVPLGTVKSRIRMAFAKLRSALETSEGEGQ